MENYDAMPPGASLTVQFNKTRKYLYFLKLLVYIWEKEDDHDECKADTLYRLFEAREDTIKEILDLEHYDVEAEAGAWINS